MDHSSFFKVIDVQISSFATIPIIPILITIPMSLVSAILSPFTPPKHHLMSENILPVILQEAEAHSQDHQHYLQGQQDGEGHQDDWQVVQQEVVDLEQATLGAAKFNKSAET